MFKIFKDSKGRFYSPELEHIYYVKTLNTITNEIKMMIISWYLIDVEQPFIRVYDLELEGEKFLFDVEYEDGLYLFHPRENDILKIQEKYNILIISEQEQEIN